MDVKPFGSRESTPWM
uniref:Uncharacterized protein n=1 Tax=Arundo donax TaxID=35708 RepID=A0A0A9HG61_ARUDO